MKFVFLLVCILTLCTAKVYYITRGEGIQYIDPTENAPSGRLNPFYIRRYDLVPILDDYLIEL